MRGPDAEPRAPAATRRGRVAGRAVGGLSRSSAPPHPARGGAARPPPQALIRRGPNRAPRSASGWARRWRRRPRGGPWPRRYPPCRTRPWGGASGAPTGQTPRHPPCLLPRQEVDPWASLWIPPHGPCLARALGAVGGFGRSRRHLLKGASPPPPTRPPATIRCRRDAARAATARPPDRPPSPWSPAPALTRARTAGAPAVPPARAPCSGCGA